MSAILSVLYRLAGRFYSTAQDESALFPGYRLLTTAIEISAYVSNHRLHTRGIHFERLYFTIVHALQLSCASLQAMCRIEIASGEILKATNGMVEVICSVLDTTIVPAPEVTTSRYPDKQF